MDECYSLLWTIAAYALYIDMMRGGKVVGKRYTRGACVGVLVFVSTEPLFWLQNDAFQAANFNLAARHS